MENTKLITEKQTKLIKDLMKVKDVEKLEVRSVDDAYFYNDRQDFVDLSRKTASELISALLELPDKQTKKAQKTSMSTAKQWKYIEDLKREKDLNKMNIEAKKEFNDMLVTKTLCNLTTMQAGYWITELMQLPKKQTEEPLIHARNELFDEGHWTANEEDDLPF